MKPQENKISAMTEKYLEAMKSAAADGGNLADYIDTAGMNALRKITMSANKDSSPSMIRSIPTVTEIDERGVARGYDLFSLLIKQRIIELDGTVDDNMASIACASLLYLNSDASGDPSKEIKVHINSGGGSVLAGNAIYDVMRSIAAPVTTVGIGFQASMGSILLAAGDTRKMTRGSKLMIHSIGSGTEGKLADQEISLEVTRRLFDEMKAVYVRHIGLTPEFWDLICARDTWLTADQAHKIGFIDEVIVGDRKPAPYERAAAEFLQAAQDKREAQVPKTIQEIKNLLLNTSADDGKGEKLRAECIVALAQMPEYWTPELKAKKEAQAAKAAASNDNAGGKAVAPAATKKVVGGPDLS